MAYDWETFGVTVAIDVVVFTTVLLLFNYLRSRAAYRKFYAPRYYVKSPGYRRPKPLPAGFNFSWVQCLFRYTEDEILAVSGYDGLVYLRVFSFGIQLFGILSLVMFAMVLPVNWTGDLVDETKDRQRSGDDDEVEATDFDKVTMANVEEESSVLWVHLVAVWIVTFITLFLLFKYHKAAVDLRIEYLATTKKGEQSHTIFVTDIPGVRFGHPLDRLMHSILFKFLPAGVKKRIQDSVDAMTNMAATGIGAIGDLTAAAVARGRGDGTSREALLDQPEDDSLSTFVRPVAKEITDMDPAGWIRGCIDRGMSHEQAVELMYRQVFPEGEVCCANIILNTTALEPLVARLESTVQSLEDLLDQYAIEIRKGGKIRKRTTRVIPIAEGKWATERWGQTPVKVDSLEFLPFKIEKLKEQILEEEAKAREQITSSAFVVFNTRWSQVVGASAFFHHFERVWNSQAAPNPREIVWENLKWRSWERKARRVTIWFLFFLLCSFFVIPIAAVQTMIEVDRLEDYDIIGDIVKFPIVSSLVQAVIPNLVLEIFLALLPTILAIMNHYQGFISRSAIDTEVTRKYFIFLIITVFMVNFTARSFLQQLDLIFDDPSSIVDALGSSAPQASTFFLYFIMTQALISGATEMLQIPGLVMTWVLTKFAGTQRAKDRIWQSKPLTFGDVLSRHTLTLFLGIVFAVINPFILPVTFVYFLLMMLYNRYKLLYMLSEDYQSGGELWNHVSPQLDLTVSWILNSVGL